MGALALAHSALVPFAFGSGVGAFVRLPQCPEHPCECTCNCGSFASGFGIYSLCLAFAAGIVACRIAPRVAAFATRRRETGEKSGGPDFAAVARAQAARRSLK